jgi:predicted nuclease of predicted toxin-antitoxin system
VKFKLDENLPASAAATLGSAGHDVDTVAGEGLTGAGDPDVVSAATGAGRILVSLDVTGPAFSILVQQQSAAVAACSALICRASGQAS